jgi:hypothetical protein
MPTRCTQPWWMSCNMDSDEEESWMELFVYTLVGGLFILGIWPAIFVAGVVRLPFAIVGAGVKGIRRIARGGEDVVPRKRLRAEEPGR